MTPERLDSLLRMYMPVSAHEEARRFGHAVAREAWREAIEECATVARAYEPRCDVCPSGVENAIRALEDE